ncbi:hypothetical protein DMP23_47785 [Amycolatopsis sp. A1MSW2902]|uniref:hypothetical protein n=1 Tax=Amycolatopsis sp. A1MSW2902 TaxID=687413 RepID=UPI00307DC028
MRRSPRDRSIGDDDRLGAIVTGQGFRWIPSAAARTLGLVHVCDVEVGQTYDVVVPEQLPRSRYPSPPGRFGLWDQLRLQRGERFAMTVTGTDPDADPPMVDGLRVITAGYVEVLLVDDQVAQLGLPPGSYRIAGMVRPDRDGGRIVEFPHTIRSQVPARWLRRPARPVPTVAVDLDDEQD